MVMQQVRRRLEKEFGFVVNEDVPADAGKPMALQHGIGMFMRFVTGVGLRHMHSQSGSCVCSSTGPEERVGWQ
jgi:hypothetical protein